MKPSASLKSGIRVGDIDGLGTVYSIEGVLIPHADEPVEHVGLNWDVDVISPWRKVLPKVLFEGFKGKASSRLYVTPRRIVVVRDIDSWRVVKGELTPLGIPNATAKKGRLDALMALGAHQFCEIIPERFRVVRIKQFENPRALIYMRLLDSGGVRYAATMWKTDGPDSVTLRFISSRFHR